MNEKSTIFYIEEEPTNDIKISLSDDVLDDLGELGALGKLIRPKKVAPTPKLEPNLSTFASNGKKETKNASVRIYPH